MPDSPSDPSSSGVPDELLRPRDSWSDPAAYDAQAAKLAGMFHENVINYADQVSAEVSLAGPKRAQVRTLCPASTV